MRPVSAQNPLRVGAFSAAGVLNIGHRGARAFAPENTLPSFQKAAALGCDMIEFDVHLSKDGEMVVCHDDDLLRCSDAVVKFPGRESYFVSDFTAAEIDTLDAGGWYADQLARPAVLRQPFLQPLRNEEMEQFIRPDELVFYSSGETRIPTLRRVLEVAAESAIMANIEIKSMPRMYPGIAAAVVRLVEAMGIEHAVLISSFDHEQLVKVRRLNQTIATAVLSSDRLARIADYSQLLDADAYHPGCYGNFDSVGFGSVEETPDFHWIDNIRAAGRGVNVWTCNDEHQMELLVGGGATGLISDYPNRVQRVLQRLGVTQHRGE